MVLVLCTHFSSAQQAEPDKVLHAEPLYVDLIRDLGARKGEREWNVGAGMFDDIRFDKYELLVEYEWAPIHRLGLEVELPFTFFTGQVGKPRDSIPSNQLDGLQAAIQWTFLVNKVSRTSMALGYLNLLELSDFSSFGDPWFVGNLYNPFVVIAQRIGGNFHSLIYTGPVFEQSFESQDVLFSYDLNLNFHYMIPSSRNFIGVEMNGVADQGDFQIVMRPQMRLGIAHNFLVGIVTGIPLNKENERFSSFLRLIWEPKD